MDSRPDTSPPSGAVTENNIHLDRTREVNKFSNILLLHTFLLDSISRVSKGQRIAPTKKQTRLIFFINLLGLFNSFKYRQTEKLAGANPV